LTNLSEIIQFIAEDNPYAAEKLGHALVKKVEPLSQFPKLGSVFSRLNRDDVREVSVPPYRIIYQILEEKKLISILTIWHGARLDPELP